MNCWKCSTEVICSTDEDAVMPEVGMRESRVGRTQLQILLRERIFQDYSPEVQFWGDFI
jgi:hypothetical protein